MFLFNTTPPQTQNSNFCIIILGTCEHILLQVESEFNLWMKLRLWLYVMYKATHCEQLPILLSKTQGIL